MAAYLHNIFNISSVMKLVLVVGLMSLPAGVGADSETQKREAIIISQSESEVSSDSEKKEDSRKNEDLEKGDQESKKKSGKDFVPSIQIDAEDAVAFPYDI